MCIMAIHAKATSANAIQAAAHNTDTVVRDLDQLANLLAARGDANGAGLAFNVKRVMESEAQSLWHLWREYVGPDAIPHGIVTGVGHEADRRMDSVMRGETPLASADDFARIAAISNGGEGEIETIG